MATYPLQIITPERTVFEGEIESLIVPAANGYLGVLAHHAPLLASLTEGQLTVRNADKKTEVYSVRGGVLEVVDNKAVILTEDLQTKEQE